jgi:hypothetical protein
VISFEILISFSNLPDLDGGFGASALIDKGSGAF